MDASVMLLRRGEYSQRSIQGLENAFVSGAVRDIVSLVPYPQFFMHISSAVRARS